MPNVTARTWVYAVVSCLVNGVYPFISQSALGLPTSQSCLKNGHKRVDPPLQRPLHHRIYATQDRTKTNMGCDLTLEYEYDFFVSLALLPHSKKMLGPGCRRWRDG